MQIYKREEKTIKRGREKKKEKKKSKRTQRKPPSRRKIEETRCPFEAVAAREEVRMVVSGGSKHALTVLWMGRWFLDFRSSPPEDDTRWKNIYHGGRILAWYTRLSSSGIFVKIASLSARSFLPGSAYLACFAITIKEIRISKRKYVERDHVDHSDRWILHGGCQFLFLLLTRFTRIIAESVVDIQLLKLSYVWSRGEIEFETYIDLWLRKLLRI